MPSAFKNSIATSVGTVSVNIYTAPALTQTTVIGFSLTNLLTTGITVSATMTKGATTVSLVKNAPIAAGGALVLFGGDQKLVLEAGNTVSAFSSAATSIDAVMSVLEIS